MKKGRREAVVGEALLAVTKKGRRSGKEKPGEEKEKTKSNEEGT